MLPMTKKRMILLLLPTLIIDIIAFKLYISIWYPLVFAIVALSQLAGAMLIYKFINNDRKLFRDNSRNFFSINISCYCIYRLTICILQIAVYAIGSAVYKLQINIFEGWISIGWMDYGFGFAGLFMHTQFWGSALPAIPNSMATGIKWTPVIAILITFIYGYFTYKKYLLQKDIINKHRIVSILCNIIFCMVFFILTFFLFFDLSIRYWVLV